MIVAENAASMTIELTRRRQELLSDEPPNWAQNALYQQKQCLAALPQGSVGPGAVLLSPLAGASGAVSVSALLFLLDSFLGRPTSTVQNAAFTRRCGDARQLVLLQERRPARTGHA
jgi:hypothetical protein